MRPGLRTSRLLSCLRSCLRSCLLSRFFSRFLFGLTALAALAGPAAAVDPPRLLIVPLPGAAPAAARLSLSDPERLRSAMELLGLEEPGPAIRVILAPEGSAPARDVPPWISGYTDGVSGVVVLLPGRAPVYPHDELSDVLDHEVVHVLVARASGAHSVPRWFNEGLALVSERSFGLRDRSVLSFQLLLTGRVGLEQLSGLFRGSGADARKAYALSLALVSDLLERHGRGLPRALFERMRDGEPFPDAFRAVTGRTLAEAEAEFWERQRGLARWLPIVSSGSAAWLLIMALAFLAWLRRRREAAAAAAAWAAEEAVADAPADPPVSGNTPPG